MASQAVLSPPEVQSDPPRAWSPTVPINQRTIGLGVALLVFLRLWYDSTHQLAPDEALYWSWSRHLSLGYLDHPPMVAWMIWLSTHLLGTNELTVRLFGILSTFGAVAATVYMAARLLHEQRALVFVAAILLLCPLVTVTATVITPDAPMIFFGMCALAVIVTMKPQHAARSWLLFGLFTGLALLSKYTAVLVPISVMIAVFSSREGRAHLKTPWPWLAGLIALAVFSPVIYWNAQHNWASFRFQLSHGLGESHQSRLGGLVDFIAGQALVWTPVLLVLGIVAVALHWKRFNRLELSERILVCAATVPLVFFGYASTHSRAEVNWPAIGYFPMTLLTVKYLMQNWSGKRVEWARLGCAIACISMILVQTPEVVWSLHLPLPGKLDDLYGWVELSEEVEDVQQNLPLIANRYQDATELSFYDDNRASIWAVGVGSRPTAFDYFSNPPDFAKIPRAAFIGTHAAEFCRLYGFEIEKETSVTIRLPSGRNRIRAVTLVRHPGLVPSSSPASRPQL